MTACGKQCFTSAHAAQRAMAKTISRRKTRRRDNSNKTPATSYFCERCSAWHWGRPFGLEQIRSRRKPFRADGGAPRAGWIRLDDPAGED